MSRTGTCPICEWPIRQHRRCPVCGWELESEELLLSDPALLKEFQRKLNKTRKQWREAAEAYRAGRLGFGEEAVQRLRRRLQEQGFHPGPAFSEWARPHPPGPFGGMAFLGIQTSEDAGIFIDGIGVGETRGGRPGPSGSAGQNPPVEARSRYGRGAERVILREGEATMIRIFSEIRPVEFQLTRQLLYLLGPKDIINQKALPL
ncbi:hypothetical protein [Thermoflexus hugenholtzii]